MMNVQSLRLILPFGALSILLASGCSVDPESTSAFRSIDPVCVESEDDLDADDWVCGESRIIDCNDEDFPVELVVVRDAGLCAQTDLTPIDGPFGPGEYSIEIVDTDSGDAVCTSELVVTDLHPPLVETTPIELWPPNHKYRSVDLDECLVVDDCDPDWTARILWVSSDEPVNAMGDGNTDADIVIVSTTGVQLRSERQGGGNGRVYTLGWAAEDGAGNVTEGLCTVSVPHDQGGGGAAVDDGEAYRIEAE